MARTIRLPNSWEPRSYQRPLWSYLERGGKRAIGIWHRRAGKDDVFLHRTACAAFERVGVYWHMLPEAAQARKAIWEAVNPRTGLRRIDEAFPAALRATTRENDMMIRFVNGSVWYVVGSDNYNSLVGSPPVGLVFSEFALADPNAWAYLSPILAENGGWAAFITTPRGRNHAYRMLRAAQGDKAWFAQVLTAAETGVFAAPALAEARRELRDLYGSHEVGDAAYEQEYECSFDAATVGAYYGRLISEAERQGRIAKVEPEPGIPVSTVWDLGVGDPTAIWWFQVVGPQVRVLDYYASSGLGIDHYAGVVKDRGYLRGDDFVPHDAKVREFGTGRTRIETMLACGLRPRLVPGHKLIDGINAARRTIPLCVFDAEKTEAGVDALRMYRASYDEEKRVLADRPVHDWTSHPADAFRYLAMSWREASKEVEPVDRLQRLLARPTLDEMIEDYERADD